MQTLIQSKVKLKMVKFDNLNYQINKNSNNSTFGLDPKFYQKLFVIIFIFCAFLIFPESPKHTELLCREYHSKDACNIW